MTRFECAIVLLELLSEFASVNGAVSMNKVEAVARAIMELGRGDAADTK